MRRFFLGLALLAALAGRAEAQQPFQWTKVAGPSITAGGVSQQVLAANGLRRALLIQNACGATESLFVAFGVSATLTDSMEIAPCGSYESAGNQSSQAVNVIAATAGHTFTVFEGQ